MKRLYKYMSALGFTGLMMMTLIGNADAQHSGGGGSHGGGSFHGGGGFHGSSGFHGGGGFRGGNSFHGNATVRSNSSFRGSIGLRSSTGYRGSVYNRGGVGYNNHNAYRGGVYNRGGAYYHGGYYRGGANYHGGYYRGSYGYHGYYGAGFRFGFGWGYPHIGLYLGVLPYGYYPFYYNSYQYYYYGGAFYRPYNGGYQVVAPPVGATVPNLPSNAQSIVIDGDQYYEASGVYYQESQDDTGNRIYVVVGKDGVLNTANSDMSNYQPMSDNDDPMMDNNATANDSKADNNATAAVVSVKVGDIVDQLPADCRKVTLSSKKYYVSPDNVFYEEFKDADGTGYRVASVPGAEQN